MLKFIKIHWFGLIVSILTLFYIAVVVLVLLSPRQDKLNRGFIPCTKQMVSKMFSCKENKALCMAGAVVQNAWCDTKVVGEGFTDWVKGKQSTPWASYIFVAVPLESVTNVAIEQQPDLTEYYQENNNIAAQMEELKKQSSELDNQIKAMDDAVNLPRKQEINKGEVKDEQS